MKQRLEDNFNFVKFLLDVLNRLGGMVKLCTTVTANVEVFALRKTFANFMTCLTKFITIRAVLNRGLEMHLWLQDFNFYFSSSNLTQKPTLL